MDWLENLKLFQELCELLGLESILLNSPQISLNSWACRIAKSFTTLMEKEMATHSSILAWRIPWTEEPGGLQSRGSQRVGHNWVTTHTHYHSQSCFAWTSLRDSPYLRPMFCWVICLQISSQVGPMVKNPLANAGDKEIQVWSLIWEDHLEKEMATHSSILAWEIPCTEDPGGLQSMGLQKSQTWLSD